ncbi:MAG TPA: inorganic phosphate transporter, partial [Thermotogales bacterium]|nr:inorganic phosphate transporter [Thermotogales bacterium]
MWLVFIPAIFFGWALGANDAANIFGPLVGTGVVRYRTAVIVTAIFVITGAMLEGARGLETISNLSVQDIKSAGISALSAAISVALMTYFGLPVSSSQAIVGSIVGIGLLKGQVNWGILVKVLICWVTTP